MSDLKKVFYEYNVEPMRSLTVSLCSNLADQVQVTVSRNGKTYAGNCYV